MDYIGTDVIILKRIIIFYMLMYSNISLPLLVSHIKRKIKIKLKLEREWEFRRECNITPLQRAKAYK